ncbi:FG-GAP-like repeat-containing protein [Dyadobacter crusticola]|uniref:FG-GAP-like repeat-containing protein n=1 Tax=Dyadobacter crusticola TaxID=292407 RepID=UPI000557E08D|nr:FG-GAP-like repeat-containing protein [Dyadobacter crusticola]
MKHSYKIYLLVMAGVSLFAGLSLPMVKSLQSSEKTISFEKPKSPDIPAAALGSIQESLSRREYHISYDAKKDVYQSPNRQHNLRAYYEPGMLTVCNRKDSVDHNFRFRMINKGIFVDHKLIRTEEQSPRFVLEENRAEIRYDAVVEQYVNSEAGIRQNFIIGKPAEGSEQLEVKLAVEGAALRDLGNNELELSPKGASWSILTYKDLKCWDADGNMLAAGMSGENELITISVDVKGATFPVTIDPIIANGNPANAILVPEVNQAHAWLGGSVASAGDVNGDGYSDVIVAASKYDNGQVDEGAAWVYYGSAGGLNLGNPVMLQGDQAGARFGCFVSTAGDINKDGYSDIMVGSHMYDKGQTNEGAVFVYHGSAAGISTTATLVLEGNQAEANFGNAMGLAGDVNGDGYSDVVIGARAYDSGQLNEGVAFVYHGSAQGLTANNPVKIEGNQAESMFGFTATGAGDVNGDGYSDIMIGARLFDKGQVDEGAVFIYHGSALGINANAPAVTLESNQVSSGFGNAIATAGDVNGDGYSDIVVGANMYDKGQTNEGAVFVHHGSAQGINPAASLTLESNQAEAQFGSSAASAGDVNGDGYADVIVGANYYDKGHSNEGAAFVYHGSNTGLGANPVSTLESNKTNAQFGSGAASAGDINGDGYSDVIVGAIAYDNGHDDEGAVFVWLGGVGEISMVTSSSIGIAQENSRMAYSVAGAGDLNGDGYSDILVGATEYDGGQTDEGAVFVCYGSPTGIGNMPDVKLECDQAFADFGISVSSAGDVNGDGFDDIIVGAELYDSGQNNEGAAFVYYGSAQGLNPTSTILECDVPNAWMGVAVSSAGDVNNDGFGDVIIGAPTFSNVESNEGAVILYLGSSNGVLKNSKKVFESNKINSFFGFSLSSGDVNGDGYSDVLCGAPKYFNGQIDEGAFFVSYGSSTGLQSNFIKFEVNQANASFGHSVSCVGDVNGDGFNDVAVGAPYYSNGQNYEGVVFLYNGSTQGLNAQGTLLEQNQPQSEFGLTVAGAGDINADGYADIIIGNPSYFSGQAWTGAAHVYFGSKGGLATSIKLLANNGVQNSAFGTSVSGAGDVNADGYSDIIAGDPYFGSGAAFVCYGNSGYCERNNLRLYNTDLTTPINQTQFAQNNFGAGLYSKSFLGGNRGKLVWETKAAGQGFSKGANNVITNSTQSSGSQNVYASLGLLGTELKNVITKQGNATKVRVRVKYDPALALTGQTYGPWRYLSSHLGGGGVSPVPEEEVSPMAETIRRKVAASGSVLVYPNPASDAISIDLKDSGTITQVRVLTSDGKLVLQSGSQRDVDVSKLAPGKYIVLVGKADGSHSSHSILISR